MANRLKMAKISSILTLRARGWSGRRIARELGVDRETVWRCLRLAAGGVATGQEPAATAEIHAADDPNAAMALIGSEADRPASASPSDASNPAIAPIGSEAGQASQKVGSDDPRAAMTPTRDASHRAMPDLAAPEWPPSGNAVCSGPIGAEAAARLPAVAGAACVQIDDVEAALANVQAAVQALGPPRVGQASRCRSLRDLIVAKLERGLSAVRIHQDLTSEHGAPVSYHSVRRFVARLQHSRPLPFRRMECAAGEEAQVDFGSGAPILVAADRDDSCGKTRRRRTHVLRVVLRHSRKGYSEAVFRQTTDDFIGCLENAFHHFGGVPRTLVIDNLKAAVTKADWFDPELNPRIEAFCRHYGTVMLPAKPRMARHKGKVERGVDYVQENALKDRRFGALHDQNQHLRAWEATVADLRIHGTTRKQVRAVFEQAEKPALLPLPVERFPCFCEARRTVHRDAHVAVEKAYYSVPPEYVRCEVWARWDSRTVRIFNRQMTQIALHVRHEPGRFSTHDRPIVSEKISRVERGATWLLERAAKIGAQAGRWAEAMLAQRGIQGLRVLSGLISLAKRHPAARIEPACRIAHTHGAYRLRDVRRVIEHHDTACEQTQFLDRHPIIRNLSEYDAALQEIRREELVHQSIQKAPYREPARPAAAYRSAVGKKSVRKEDQEEHSGKERAEPVCDEFPRDTAPTSVAAGEVIR